jgi:hypothetical protein
MIIGSVLYRPGYLNLWSDVSRKTMVVGFHVVSAKGTGGEHIAAGSMENISIPIVMIHGRKYSGNVGFSIPFHRAFVTSSGQIKIVDPDMAGVDDKYKGADKNVPIPSLSEADWIAAGNTGLEKPAADLAANYAALPALYTWLDAADFNANAVTDTN